MEEDIDTRKINNSFLRDHSYATEGNASPAAFRRWGRAQVADRWARPAAGRRVAETPLGPGLGRGLGPWGQRPVRPTSIRAPRGEPGVQQQVDPAPTGVKMALGDQALQGGAPDWKNDPVKADDPSPKMFAGVLEGEIRKGPSRIGGPSPLCPPPPPAE